jgi:hypothetical protein
VETLIIVGLLFFNRQFRECYIPVLGL